MKSFNKKGQSLFEVMFAIAIAALVLIAIVSLSTRSVKTSDFSRNNALASKYAQEGAEWVRQQRDTDWTTFTTGNIGRDIELGSLSLGGGGNPIGSTIFRRYLRMEYDGGNTDKVLATVRVTWEDGSGPHEVTNNTKLTNWRK